MLIPSWEKRCGVAQYTGDLVAALKGAGAEVSVITETARAIPVIREKKLNILHIQFEYALYDIGSLQSLLRQPDLHKIRTVATVHDFFLGGGGYNNLIREAFPTVILHSSATREAYISIGLPPSRIRMIPMGCKSYSVAPVSKSRERLRFGRNDLVMGFFGLSQPHKGIMEFVTALSEVKTWAPGVKAVIFSADPDYGDAKAYFAEVRRLISAHKLDDSVRIISDYLPESEIVDLLGAMSVVVLPYRESGYIGTSAAVRTAMAAKVPVIVSDTYYFSDLGNEVLKIGSIDPKSISDAVKKVATDKAFASALVERAQAFLAANSWSRTAVRHIELYKSL